MPASWPVYRLGRGPTRCVRYDRHAVYLGRPGADQQCPAHLVGRTTTISVQAAPAGAAPAPAFAALWDRGRNLDGGPYLPEDWWPGAHRIKQYLGPHLRTVHQRTVDIDSDRVYGLVYR